MFNSSNVMLLGRNGIVREGLRRILSDSGFEILQSAADTKMLRTGEAGAANGPDLLIVDNGCGSYDASSIQELKQRFVHSRLIVLVDSFDFDQFVESIRAGADGFLVKDMSCERLIGALQLAALGEKVLPAQLADELIVRVPDYPQRQDAARTLDCANLSSREVDVLACLTLGYPNKVISRRLNISEATVKVHVKAVLRKLEVKNRTQAAIWATSNGIQTMSVEANSYTPPVRVTPAQGMQPAMPLIAVAAQ